MNRLLVASTLALAFTATPSLAEDTGLIPYAGVLVGTDNIALATNGLRTSKPVLAYGVVLGVDSKFSEKTRIGLEAEYMDSSAKGALAVDPLNSAKAAFGRDMYVGLRVGYEVRPNLLAFVKAGYTNRRVAMSGTAAGLVGGVFAPVPFAYNHNLNGYRAGAGIEYGTKLRARLEYRFSDYAGLDGSTDPLAPSLGIKSKNHQFVAGMLYGF